MDLQASIEAIWDLLDEDRIDEAAAKAADLVDRYPESAATQLVLAVVHYCMDQPGESREAAREALRLCSDSEEEAEIRPSACHFLARSSWRLWDFDEAERVLRKALKEHETAENWDLLAWLLEFAGRREEAAEADRRAERLEPENFSVPARLTEEEVESIVSEALANLPDIFQEALKNVPIVIRDFLDKDMALSEGVEAVPLAPDVLGLIVGAPVVDDYPTAPSGKPATIFLFKGNLERACADRETLIEEVTTTLFHEIAHHLGFEEDQMSGLGLD